MDGHLQQTVGRVWSVEIERRNALTNGFLQLVDIHERSLNTAETEENGWGEGQEMRSTICPNGKSFAFCERTRARIADAPYFLESTRQYLSNDVSYIRLR